MEPKNDLRLYILMRNDLQSLVPGRCMAQAAHAGNAVVHEHGKHVAVREWQAQTEQGFGTTIVLSVSINQIDSIFSCEDLKDWLIKGMVVDPDYVVRVTHEIAQFMPTVTFIPESADEKTIGFTRKEVTCAYILGTKEELSQYLDELSLY
jgi:hypothetical protein